MKKVTVREKLDELVYLNNDNRDFIYKYLTCYGDEKKGIFINDICKACNLSWSVVYKVLEFLAKEGYLTTLYLFDLDDHGSKYFSKYIDAERYIINNNLPNDILDIMYLY